MSKGKETPADVGKGPRGGGNPESKENQAPAGHPIHILLEEHKALLLLSGELVQTAQAMRTTPLSDAQMKRLLAIKEAIQDSESHYTREENVLFPYLEKHGMTQPPAIMWMEHDMIRAKKKELYNLVDAHASAKWRDFVNRLGEIAPTLNEMLEDHFYKENRILFTAALRLITEQEWISARLEFDEMGYCSFTPEEARIRFGEDIVAASEAEIGREIVLETGALSKAELEALLNTLPIEITFVDAEDTVRYINQTKERIFPRTKATIGRKVQLCHPKKSLHLVTRILQDFRSGRRDVAEFWIQPKGLFVHVRYYAVRDQEGAYLGTMEVVQDVSRIRMLKGEQRMLDDGE